MKKKTPLIWVLLDERAGTRNQALGLAERLKLPFHEIHVKFGKLSRLPNFIFGSSLVGIRNKKDFRPPYPDIVISSGRRLAKAALWIKKQNPNTKLVHIMLPRGSDLSLFSLIVVPSHDKHVPKEKNILVVDGTVHRVQPERLTAEKKKWTPFFKKYKHPYLVVIIGGKAKNKQISEAQIMHLIQELNGTTGSVLLTTSRRTPAVLVDLFKTQLKVPHYLYIPGETEGENPYFGMLALSDATIITGDSISMISEAAIADAPIYIYAPPGSVQPKHGSFHDILYKKGYANPLFSGQSKKKKLDPFPTILKAMKERKII